MRRLICICGPDGSGKSTQVDSLCDVYSSLGFRTRSIWMRFHHITSIPILLVARIFKLSSADEDVKSEIASNHNFSRNRILSAAYGVSMLIDTTISYNILVRPWLIFSKRIVICDRFIPDTLIDVMVSTGQDIEERSFVRNAFVRLIPDKAHIIILIADVPVLIERRMDIGQDIHLSERVSQYLKLTQLINCSVINAGQPRRGIQTEILASYNILSED